MKQHGFPRAALAVASVAALALTAACGSSGSGGSGSSGSPIVVGVVQPYSGAEAYYGKYENDAWKMAEQNYGSSIDGHTIKLVKGDSKCDPATAVSAVRRVLAQQPTIINAPDCSGDTLAMLPITTAAKVPLISENLSPDITTKGSHYVWRAQASDAATNKLFGKYIAGQSHQSIGVINDTTSYGVANSQTLVDGLSAAGVSPAVKTTYDISATDYSGQILKLKQAGVDAAYMEGYDLQEGNLVKQARSLGLSVPIYGPTTASDGTFLKAAGSAAEGVTFATSFLPGWSPSAKSFAKKWQDEFGYPPNMDSVGMYQAAVVTIKALQKAGAGASADQVNSALKGLQVSGLPEGSVSFTATGDLAHPLVLVGQWHNKTTKLVKVLAKP
jgi:branched-chain amino acid transport system substrate-binding protein